MGSPLKKAAVEAPAPAPEPDKDSKKAKQGKLGKLRSKMLGSGSKKEKEVSIEEVSVKVSPRPNPHTNPHTNLLPKMVTTLRW